MASIEFIDHETIVTALWLNDVDSVVYSIIGNGTIIPATKAAARTNLGVMASTGVAALESGTYTTGDLIYASGTNTLAKLAAGDEAEVLTMTSGVPTWQPASGGGGGLTALPYRTVPTSGTSFTFTGIPSTAQRITLQFDGVIINTGFSGDWNIRVGTSGGIMTTGYEYCVTRVIGTSTTQTSFYSVRQTGNAYGLFAPGMGGSPMTGRLVLEKIGDISGTEDWVWTASNISGDSGGGSSSVSTATGTGYINLSSPLTQIQLITTSAFGTSGGYVGLLYE